MKLDKGIVYLHGKRVGILERKENEFSFQYDQRYVLDKASSPISFSLPLRIEPYLSNNLHGYFSGLVSEGWLKKMQSKHQSIDINDEFTLLVNNGEDLAGAVTIKPY